MVLNAALMRKQHLPILEENCKRRKSLLNALLYVFFREHLFIGFSLQC